MGALLVGMTTFSAGCFSGVRHVKVFSGGSAPVGPEGRQSYVLRVSGMANPPSLREKEAMRHLRAALSAKGLYPAPRPELAEVSVEIAFEIGPQRTRTVTEEEPIVKQVRGATRTVTETTTGTARDGQGVRTRTERDTDTTEVIGYRKVELVQVYHEKTLRITILPARGAKAGAGHWHIVAMNDDSSDDLRELQPVLAAAVIEYLTRGTDGEVVAAVSRDDVAFVNKGP